MCRIVCRFESLCRGLCAAPTSRQTPSLFARPLASTTSGSGGRLFESRVDVAHNLSVFWFVGELDGHSRQTVVVRCCGWLWGLVDTTTQVVALFGGPTMWATRARHGCLSARLVWCPTTALRTELSEVASVCPNSSLTRPLVGAESWCSNSSHPSQIIRAGGRVPNSLSVSRVVRGRPLAPNSLPFPLFVRAGCWWTNSSAVSPCVGVWRRLDAQTRQVGVYSGVGEVTE